MSKRLFTFLVTGLVATMLLSSAAWGVCVVTVVGSMGAYGAAGAAGGGDPLPPTTAQASTQINPGAAPAGGLTLSQEGRTERVSDILVHDDGVAPGCFSATSQTIRMTYNATLTSPTSISAATTSNFDVFDSAGSAGLVILASSTVGLAPGGTPQTVITVSVQQAGTLGNLTTSTTGSAFRIKNLRVDATPVAVAGTVTGTVSASLAGSLTTATFTVGTAAKTISTTTVPTLVAGAGTQSSGGTLTGLATFSFVEGFTTSLKQAGTAACTTSTKTCVSGIANDIATNATSLIFDSGTTIPSGVTVTWPATISNSATAAAGSGYILTARTGANVVCSGGATPCFAIYDVNKTDTGVPFTLQTTTGATASGVTAGTATVPVIGVGIGTTSGSGTATIKATFGPGEAAGSGNDDVNASAIPRYISTNTAAAVTRLILSGNWFTITPVRTTLLFPFASTTGGFNTGISVANTGNDTGVFGTGSTANQTGGLTFYFFPTGGTPFTLNSDLTAGGTALPNCRGLDASGRVAPGGIFACGLDKLLLAATKTSFDGYVIVVASFNRAHGFSVQFNGSQAPYAANNALILGSGARNDGLAEGLFE